MRMYFAIALFLMIPLAQGILPPSAGPDIWLEAGLDLGYAKKFMNNQLCGKSRTWFQACHKGIEKGIALLEEGGILPPTMALEWKVQSFEPDVEAWLRKIDEVPGNARKSMMYGMMVNEYLSVFDAHAKILPVALLNQMLGSNEANLKSEIIYRAKHKFALMKISVFRSGTCEMVESELQILLSVEPEALILDLRGNGGGRNDEARCVYRLFDGDRLPITRKYLSATLLPAELDLRPTSIFRNKGISSEDAMSRPSTFQKIPLAVLVNGKSGSVSELIAAGLQDTHRAWLVGDSTFGKGTFQVSQGLHFHTSLRLIHSIYEIVRATGSAIQFYGVTPNFTVPARMIGPAAPVLREKDLFPTALKPSVGARWKEDRRVERRRLQKCAGLWADATATDYQQDYAMAVLHCSLQHNNPQLF